MMGDLTAYAQFFFGAYVAWMVVCFMFDLLLCAILKREFNPAGMIIHTALAVCMAFGCMEMVAALHRWP